MAVVLGRTSTGPFMSPFFFCLILKGIVLEFRAAQSM